MVSRIPVSASKALTNGSRKDGISVIFDDGISVIFEDRIVLISRIEYQRKEKISVINIADFPQISPQK
jgi:hypothetical protein